MQILARVQCATLHVNFWVEGEYKGKNSWLPFKSRQIGSRLNWLSILQYLIMKRPFTRYANVNVKKCCLILQLRRYTDRQHNRQHLKHQHLTAAHPSCLVHIAEYPTSIELKLHGFRDNECPLMRLVYIGALYRV